MRALPCLAALVLTFAGARAAQASDMVLICYLWQSGGGGMPTQLIRRIEIDTKERRVAIADNTGAGFQPLGYYGKLVSSDEAGIVFDYASPQSTGRGTINLGDGSYTYRDGKVVTTGHCAPSQT
ncbi:MAG TPA: hypothetical protein VE650_10415 [Acetobacteraceae bacterium]|jgi:hypothetical protein|nr:hypothetical protein [Acetobacteraceae bacterium]